MNPWNAKRREVWRRIADHIDEAELAKLDAVQGAFERLRALDAGLAQLALDAFCDPDFAAWGLAYQHADLSRANVYTLLANGQRARVAEWLRERIEDNRRARAERDSRRPHIVKP